MAGVHESRMKKRKAAVEATEQEPDGLDASATVEPAKENEDEDEVEVEVLSHAEQRKRRRLEKKKLKQAVSTQDGDADAAATVEAVDGGPGARGSSKSEPGSSKAEQPKQSRSTYGIWVGNLAFKTDADKLREFFSLCGNITRINLPKGTKFQPNKGFAYIDFDTREAVTEAVALSESGLDGRRLLIKDSSDYKGRPKNENVDAAARTLLGSEGQVSNDAKAGASAEKSLSKTARKILERQKNPPAPTLFIGNLAYDATIESIREAFEARALARKRWESKKGVRKSDRKGKGKASAEDGSDEERFTSESESEEESDAEASKPSSNVSSGQGGAAGIRQVRIGTFEDSGKCKGWAFIDFYTAAEATQSLIDGRNHYMNGRTLTVEYASADAVRRGGGKMEGVEIPTSTKSGRPAPRSKAAGDLQGSKRKRESHNEAEEHYEDQTVNTHEEPEMPKQAFYRPPLPLQPWKEVAKTHKPNKEERQALREERKSKGKRQKPGAALASAPREKIAIQPGAGKKITFD